jgi:putative component of membrane protein insertase Oxa1/YidC/SpoIIIJ protein YidD
MKFFCLLLLYLFCFLSIYSQNYVKDLELILKKKEITNTDFKYYKRGGNDQLAFISKGKSLMSKINPIIIFLKGAMLFYQNVISAQLSKECPYEITCSNFSKQSIKKFGFVKGVFISADRLTRCNRIAILDVNYSNIDPITGGVKDSLSKYCVNE